jgi:adenylate cyclase
MVFLHKSELIMDEKNQRQNVLAVEDDKFLSRALSDKLQREGYSVTIAENGDQAVQAAQNRIPDVVLLDLVMPKKNGFEVLEELQLDKRLKHIPVVVLTNLSQESDKEKCKAFGVVEYLVKSDTPISDIVKRVKYILESTEK